MGVDQTTSEQAASTIGQHTPGPWRLAKEPPHCGLTVTLYGYGPRTLGNIHTGCEEYMANARLIAAAPDMLAALRKLIECLELAERNDDLPCPFAGYGRAFIDNAKAAITKATGTTSGDR